MNKYRLFQQIAATLNNGFGIRPLLFGSLGLSIRIPDGGIQPDDIDILVPTGLLADHWSDLIRLMDSLGFHLVDLHEHEFSNGDTKAAFAQLESLEPFAGVDYRNIPVQKDGSASFLLLTLEDYLKVYTASAKDGYRADKKHKNDTAKIELIKQALFQRVEKEQIS